MPRSYFSNLFLSGGGGDGVCFLVPSLSLISEDRRAGAGQPRPPWLPIGVQQYSHAGRDRTNEDLC